MDDQSIRAAALIASAAAWSGQSSPATPDALTAYARQLIGWIAGTDRLALIAVIDSGPATELGGTMPQTVSATVDNTTVTLKAQPEDDHGNPTPDQLTWANDDTASAVATWAASADTKTYTGTLTHAEGTVNITVTDPSAPSLAPAQIQLVVGPGAASQINVTATVA